MGDSYDDPRRLRKLYHDEGMTQGEIADALECSRPTIIDRMKKFGIQSRDPGGGSPDAPHKDEEKVRKLYEDEGLPVREVADRLGTAEATLRYWMDKFDIQRRDRSQHLLQSPAYHRTSTNGYEEWQVRCKGDRHQVKVHRLAAVAWFGFHTVADMDVHHQNGVGWDNREENIELMTHEEHARHHAEKTEFWKYRGDINGEKSDG